MKKLLIIAAILFTFTQAYAEEKKIDYTDLTPFPKWTRVLRAQPIKFTKERPVSVKDLERINTIYNTTITYKRDECIKTDGKEVCDYWQTPDETEKLGKGDCEDYAIAKYYALAELGVNPKNMQIVTGYHYAEMDLHSVLQVKLEGKTYILDLRHFKSKDDSALNARKYYNTQFGALFGLTDKFWEDYRKK